MHKREGGNFDGEKGPGPGLTGTCQTVDILKVTQQGAAQLRRGCRLGYTRWWCTMAQPGEYD